MVIQATRKLMGNRDIVKRINKTNILF